MNDKPLLDEIDDEIENGFFDRLRAKHFSAGAPLLYKENEKDDLYVIEYPDGTKKRLTDEELDELNNSGNWNKYMKYTEEEQALLDRINLMLEAVDLETHVPLSYDMDDPLGLKRKDIPERLQKLGALFDQRKIDVTEFRQFIKLENLSKQGEI